MISNRSFVAPLTGEIAQLIGLLIIAATLVWGFAEGARIYSAAILVGLIWFFVGGWLRHRSGGIP